MFPILDKKTNYGILSIDINATSVVSCSLNECLDGTKYGISKEISLLIRGFL
jgi:uncharacterized protein YlaN (UPF0358 family)